MKKLFVLIVAIPAFFTSCDNRQVAKETEDQKIAQQAIQIHDEIMPQISIFDKNDILIDSILANLPQLKKANIELDTAVTRTELTKLKADLESATDHMMTWMKDYDPSNKEVNYQQKMLDQVIEMKKQFTDAAASADKSLAAFKK